MHTINDSKRRCYVALLYLLAKISASGNFKHALYIVSCNLHAQLRDDQTRRCRKKKFLFTSYVSIVAQRRRIFEAGCFVTQARLYRKPIGLHGCSIIAAALFRIGGIVNAFKTVRAAGLKRLSAILRSYFQERRQTLSSPESPRRNHVDRENEMQKFRSAKRREKASNLSRAVPQATGRSRITFI